MSYFQPIIWCAIGAVDPDILLKAYPREKLFNPIIVRSIARYLIRTATAIAGYMLIVEGDYRPITAILLGAANIRRMRGVKKLANTFMTHLLNFYSHSRLMPQA
jgi:hypothetical protein